MSEYFSGNFGSSFPNQNILFNSLSGLTGQELQKNQLAIQGQQMDLTAADHEQVGRLAAGLLNEPDLAKRAQYYAQGVGVLQSQGLAKYAPPTLPDEGVLRSLVNQSVPVADQYKMGLITAPGTKEILDRVFGGGAGPSTAPPAATAPGSVATAPSGTIEPAAFNNATAVRDGLIKRGADPDTATALAASALHESVANPRTGRGDNGNAAGLFMWTGPRLQAYTDANGHPPDGAPLDEQLDFVMKELNGSEAPAAAKIAQAQGLAGKAAAVSQYYLRPKDTQGEMQRRSATALQLQQQIGGGATTASTGSTTATTAPAGGGGTPGSYQVASTAPVPPPGSTAAPVADAPAPGATTAATPPAPPVGQPQAAPAPQPAAPLATGIQSPQFQQAQDKLRQAYAIKAMPGYATSPQLQAAAGLLTEQAGALAKADTFREDTQGGIHGQRSVLTNQFIPDPARRMMALADGTVINDQGKAIAKVPPQELVKDANNQYWYVPKYPTPGPGGTLAPAQPVPGQQLPTPGYVKEQEAEADRLSKTRDAVLERAKESASANTMISNTETALADAQKGNLGSGALSPDKLRIVATAKALGINLAPFGIDASKLAAAQVTREQLQQLNGAILRKMYPQRITNADLAISGTVLPNYGLDPEALTANFDIYKKQNAYDTQMAQDMLTYEHEHNGSLKGWEQQWYSKNNFATGPLDNLFGDAQGGRLASGSGGSSGQATPAATLPPKALSSLTEGHVTVFSNGQQWTLRNGQPVQVK